MGPLGDGYMAIAGAPVARNGHVEAICDLAWAMQLAMPELNERIGIDFGLRIGVNTGQVIAGVIGTSRFSYDLWGATVNLAGSRVMRSRVRSWSPRRWSKPPPGLSPSGPSARWS